MKRSFYSLFLVLALGLTACGRQGDSQIAYNNGAAAVTSLTCSEGGVDYVLGSNYASTDGCNTCSCVKMPDGSAASMCTQIACLPH